MTITILDLRLFVHAVTPALGTLELFGDRKPPRCWPASCLALALGSDSLIEGAGSIIIVWRFSGAFGTLARDSTMLETMDSAPGSPGPG